MNSSRIPHSVMLTRVKEYLSSINPWLRGAFSGRFPKQKGHFAHVIGIMDYASGDPAQADISALANIWFGLHSHLTWFTVDDYSPLEVGFNLATRRCIQGPRVSPFTVVLGNAAPRKQKTVNLEAAPFVVFQLTNGVWVFTTLSDLAEELEFIGLEGVDGPIRKLKIQTDGTQFRSLFLPEYAARFFLAQQSNATESLDQVVESEDLRPKVAEMLAIKRGIRIAHVDSFGNPKTSMFECSSDCPQILGEMLEVTIGGVTIPVQRGRHLGDVTNENDLCFYPGSSVTPNKKKFMEICWLQRSAAHRFRNEEGLARLGFRARANQEVTIRCI